VPERVRHTLELEDMGNNFLSRPQIVQQLNERIDKWDSIKLKSFYTIKEMVTKLKKQPQNGRKSLPV
jgi:hypothetical protein